MEVLLVLTHYKRLHNMPRVLEAWDKQTVHAAHTVVVDNSPARPDGEQYPNLVFQKSCVDDVWRMQRNLGCPCHFYPALALPQYKYTLFADDDFVPGSRAIETALELAESLHGYFATIGHVTRIIRDGKYSGRVQPVRLPNKLVPCDLTCRTSFVKTSSLIDMLRFRQKLLDRFPEDAPKLCGIHDDFLLCCGVQYYSKQSSYAWPIYDDDERLLVKENLPEDGAIWRRPDHFKERQEMLNLCRGAGWLPIQENVLGGPRSERSSQAAPAS